MNYWGREINYFFTTSARRLKSSRHTAVSHGKAYYITNTAPSRSYRLLCPIGERNSDQFRLGCVGTIQEDAALYL